MPGRLAGTGPDAYLWGMRAQWTQYHWRRWQAGQRTLTWRERLALILIVLAAIPVLLLVFAGLFFFVVGLATVGLAGWLVAALLKPRRPQAPPSVIAADYVRLPDEPQDRSRP
ncbi:MAG TPA: hypothetical protein VF031_04535 [Alphaproteobacteria bacterium]